jgi:2-iminoacetate synthase
MPTEHATFLDEAAIFAALDTGRGADATRVRDVLAKARDLHGLDLADVAALTGISDPTLLNELFQAARHAKETIYGRRLVLFAPLYVSNLCANDCAYCAFRLRNRSVQRRVLTQDEVQREVETLERQGHKRVLLVAGESYPGEGFDYVLRCIDTVYATRTPPSGEIRRVNVNVAPLTVEEFRTLAERKIGTYQLFQETYHRETYARVHLLGRKRDFDWRATVMDRAMAAGLVDVGVGILFGLFDWRFEVLALLQHAAHLEQRFGVGPHTISVPRLEPAIGSDVAAHPPFAVPDIEFRKLVAILRLAVPYTGIILSTRETAGIRRETFALGVSQISAGSRTNPGGYTEGEHVTEEGQQFSLGDHRSLDEVVRDVATLGYIPSFCTGCYRLGRIGKDFMDLAKPGEIRAHCDPNALSTFQEYLLDYATPETRVTGERLIEDVLAGMGGREATVARKLVDQVRVGKRDVYV